MDSNQDASVGRGRCIPQSSLRTDAVSDEELARSAATHLIENFAEIPLFWFRNEVFANGDVVDSWTYPGLGAGRTTQFDLIKPAG